jgi:RNA polymerase sigma-70 factor (ECF subfamily)
MGAQRAVKAANEERKLVARALRGEESAFQRLFDLHAAAVHAAAARVLGNGADADDVVQDTFVAAFQSLHRFKGRSALRTWLYRIAVNFALRQRAARRCVSTDDVDLASSPDVERDLVARVDLDRVLSALATLDQDKRAALVLHEIEGWTARQIARSERRPLSTILSRLVRGRRILVRLFDHERKMK